MHCDCLISIGHILTVSVANLQSERHAVKCDLNFLDKISLFIHYSYEEQPHSIEMKQ